MKLFYTSILLILIIYSCNSAKSILEHNFSAEQTELIMQSDSTIPMHVYKITNKNDSLLLRTKSTYIKPDANSMVLQRFVKRLYKTVTDSISLGVGIAAPQVGILKNIIWVQRFDKENFPFEVYLNPIITAYSSKKQTFIEGCLSIPNRSDTLYNRAFSINIEYDSMDALQHTETVEGFTAVIFQHEIDHLNGILYLDHLSKEVLENK